MRYKWKTGMWAFVFHRVSGLALSVYLVMHLFVVSSLNDKDKFETVMGFLNGRLFKVLEIGLLAAVLYHSFNGVRVFLIDFARGTKRQAAIFWVIAVIGAVIFVPGAILFLRHAGLI